MSFSSHGTGMKSRKSEIPGVTGKFGLWVQNEAGQRLTEFGQENTGHSKHPLPPTQEMTLHMNIARWSIPNPNWLYSMQPRWRSTIESAKTRPGADYGSDNEILIAKFRLKLK